MKANPFFLVALIVLLPLSLLAWAARYIAGHEQSIAQQRLQDLMAQRLDDINDSIVRHFDQVSRELNHLTTIDEFDIESLRELNRREPRFLQLFVLTADGDLKYPDPVQQLSPSESSFLTRASKMFTDRDLKTTISLTDAQDGWFVWYWDRGQNLIYWQRRPSGSIVGVALERARWVADLIGELPETKSSLSYSRKIASTFESGLRLVDAASSIVYQWGKVPADTESTKPLCEIPVASPLSSWRLQCIVPPEHQKFATGLGLQFSIWTGLFGIGLGLLALATLLLRGYARDMQEAAQQVSFVNQVSHELKTPLTNIRMYAELLERDLNDWNEPSAERPRQRMKTIVSESERLSRLIGNVLTFGQHRRNVLQPKPREVVPDDCIRRVVDRFQPSLEALGIGIDIQTLCFEKRMLDPDFLEQILDNLISNVEKYASDGKRIGIRCSTDDNMLVVLIEDNGPGIPKHQRDTIFQPFKRLNNDLHFAAGTGIGLTIARELARLHGGDVRLLDSVQGCLFEVRLKCPILR